MGQHLQAEGHHPLEARLEVQGVGILVGGLAGDKDRTILEGLQRRPG